MRSIKTIIAIVLLIAFSLSLASCGGPKLKDEDIIGKWVAVKRTTIGGSRDIGFVIEFFKDKTVTLPAGKGTWAIMGDDRLKIDILKLTMFGSLEKGLLTIAYPENRGIVVFKRK